MKFEINIEHTDKHANYKLTAYENGDGDLHFSIMENPFGGQSRCVSLCVGLVNKIVKILNVYTELTQDPGQEQ